VIIIHDSPSKNITIKNMSQQQLDYNNIKAFKTNHTKLDTNPNPKLQTLGPTKPHP
jgi:hypothetical protein